MSSDKRACGKRASDKRTSDARASDARVSRLAGNATSIEIARLQNGEELPSPVSPITGADRPVSQAQTNRRLRFERADMRWKVVLCVAVLAVLVFFSLCLTGAAGQYYLGSYGYATYSPFQVAYVLYLHAYNAIGSLTHWFDPYSSQWLLDNAEGYWAIFNRLGVIVITMLCAVLLSISGMLYQNVFKNPIAGPGMLGVSSGVTLGMMILVAVWGTGAVSMLQERYLLCYGLGALILVFVIFAGWKLSGRGRPFDVVTMLLIGSILAQLIGFVVSFMTLFVMDDASYDVYFELSQMLTVDTSELSWACLFIAILASFVPVYLLRFHMNALGLDETEMRLLGLSGVRLRGVALVCGAIMILAAQIHVGMVGLVSLVVPLVARRLFGGEFGKQMVGCACLSTILLVVCRDIADLIPFVGDGIAIGSVVGVAMVPVFLLIVARQTRRNE